MPLRPTWHARPPAAAPPRAAAPLLVLALALAAACTSTQQKELTPEEKVGYYRGNALQYYEMGDLDRAQGQIDNGLAIRPDDPQLNLLLGWVLARRGRTEDILAAEQVFRRILDEKDFRTSLGLAVALERKGVLHDEAARKIDRGERYTDAPDPHARARELRAIARASWLDAVRHYEATLARNPEDRDALNGLTRTHTLLGEEAKGLEYSDELLRLLAVQMRFLGRQLERVDLTARDEKRFRDALAAERVMEVKLRLHRSEALQRLGRLQAAKAELDRVLALDPLVTDAYSRRGQLEIQLGEPEAAVYSLDKFLALSDLDLAHPDMQRAWDLRAEAELALAERAH